VVSPDLTHVTTQRAIRLIAGCVRSGVDKDARSLTGGPTLHMSGIEYTHITPVDSSVCLSHLSCSFLLGCPAKITLLGGNFYRVFPRSGQSPVGKITGEFFQVPPEPLAWYKY
jgi:hypothetical protein